MKAAAIILSGGKSSRMGTNKALLKLNEKTNIEGIRDTLALHFDEMILVTNDRKAYEFLDLKMVEDQYPGMGPLAGLHAGLAASHFDTNLLVACDMPFVSGELAEVLVNHSSHYDAVIPVIGGHEHPLFAVYKKTILDKVEASLKEGRLRMRHLLEPLNVLYLTEEDLSAYIPTNLDRAFFNMNHPEEYEEAKKWMEVNKQE